MSARELLLQAPTTSSDQWNHAESNGAGGEFRWSRTTPVSWTVNALSESGFTIVIPWRIEVEANFIGRSRLLVDGESIAFTIDQHDDMPCIRASFAGTAIRGIALETPPPMRSPANAADDRLLGIAVPLINLQDRASANVLRTPIVIANRAAPQICLIGNCQVQSYTWLMERMLGCPVRAVADLSGAYIRQKAFQTEFLETCRGADLVLTLQNQYLLAEDIRDHTAAPIYTMMNLYFRGTLPDLCYMGSIDNRLAVPTSYHSLIILDAYRRGIPEDECERQFDITNFERLGLLETWRSSEEALIERSAGIDFPAARMITNAARRYQAFLTLNHPTVLLCYQYLATIFDRLGVPYRTFSFSDLKEPLAVHDMCIVHDEWAEYLDLPYRTTQRFKINTLDNRYVTRRELIHHFYAQYDTMPRESLTVSSPLDMVAALRLSPEHRDLVSPLEGGWIQ